MALDCNKQKILVGDKVFRLPQYCHSTTLKSNIEYEVLQTFESSIQISADGGNTKWDSHKFEIRPRCVTNWEEAMLKC